MRLPIKDYGHKRTGGTPPEGPIKRDHRAVVKTVQIEPATNMVPWADDQANGRAIVVYAEFLHETE